MIIVITQPTFLPWIGYFDQLRIADIIVLLDSVQYERRSWQNRNRIINRKGEEIMLTIPLKKSPRQTLIKDIKISDTFDLEKLIKKIKFSYGESSYLESCLSIVEKSLSKEIYKHNFFLKDINKRFIKDILDLTDINYKIFWSSDLEKNLSYNTPTERLLEICKYFKADIYLGSPGSKEYMKNELFKFYESNIIVEWHSFNHISYVKENFKPYMSVVDYMAHNSPKAFKSYLKKSSGIFK